MQDVSDELSQRFVVLLLFLNQEKKKLTLSVMPDALSDEYHTQFFREILCDLRTSAIL